LPALGQRDQSHLGELSLECIGGRLGFDDGEIEVAGIDVADDPEAARHRLGIAPQELELYDYLTGAEYLAFAARLRGMEGDGVDETVDRLLALTRLESARDRLAREYSGGMARKLALAAALVGEPPLLLLDEALVGLDPESSVRIRRALSEHCEEGGSVLLSTHALEVLETIASRVLILDDGRLVRDVDGDEMRGWIEEGRYDGLTEIYLEVTSE
ncbi:MAG: ATP-binding cassette domain-containing protein, partial [Bradymonadaceae bacterium]